MTPIYLSQLHPYPISTVISPMIHKLIEAAAVSNLLRVIIHKFVYLGKENN